MSRLDYDFSLAKKDKTMSNGVIARTLVLDRMVKQYLQKSPDAVVINIACGLDTRCYRMQGYSRWYNLDLPEVMTVRQKLLPDFEFVEERSLVEGMEIIAPVYKVIGKIPTVRNLSNRIVVLKGKQDHI